MLCVGDTSAFLVLPIGFPLGRDVDEFEWRQVRRFLSIAESIPCVTYRERERAKSTCVLAIVLIKSYRLGPCDGSISSTTSVADPGHISEPPHRHMDQGGRRGNRLFLAFCQGCRPLTLLTPHTQYIYYVLSWWIFSFWFHVFASVDTISVSNRALVHG